MGGHPVGAHLTDGDREQSRELRAHVQEKVREAGLWAPHLPAEYGGAGLDFLELAYMYEVLAYPVGAARCSASSPPTRTTSRSS